MGTLSSTKTALGHQSNGGGVGGIVGGGGGGGGGVGGGGVGGFTSLAALPVVRNNLGSRAASITGRGLSLSGGGGKGWGRMCPLSWRGATIVLAVLCCILAALLAYFASELCAAH